MASGQVYRFGAFELDAHGKKLSRDGEPIALGGHHFDLLHVLVAKAGFILSKDVLIEAAWPDVVATDNSLTQAVWALRKALGQTSKTLFIETVARRGYRFAADVVQVERRETDAALEALLAPQRAWIEGRAMLETLARDQIVKARRVFEGVLTHVPNQASAHVGLANACAMQFETTRSDAAPDTAALALAVHHAREACRLDPSYGEAWATLGFVLEQSGNHRDAPAASRRAVTLEPGNWRHHLRLASVSWGEERLRAAHRTVALLPGCPLAHWLAATVYVARDTLGEAARELTAGLEAEPFDGAGQRFSSVALHWLRGLILFAQGDEAAALAELERELAHEKDGHIYAREVCANTWYAMGAIHARAGRRDAACQAFEQAITRMPRHLLAMVATARLTGREARPLFEGPPAQMLVRAGRTVDLAMARAVDYAMAGRGSDAAVAIDIALNDSPAGSSGWILPVEALLNVHNAPADWMSVLAHLRNRAA